MTDVLALLTADRFSPHVGELFQMGDTELSLTLVAVEVQEAPAGGRTPFSLIFRGPKSPWAPENLWPVKGPDGTMHEIYIAPIHTPSPDCQDYQAVFN
jgi:hypothetical protein